MKISLIAEAIKLNSKNKANCPLCKEMLVGEQSECDKCGTDYHSECSNEMLNNAKCALLGCDGRVDKPDDRVLHDFKSAIKDMPSTHLQHGQDGVCGGRDSCRGNEDLAAEHERDFQRSYALDPQTTMRWNEQRRQIDAAWDEDDRARRARAEDQPNPEQSWWTRVKNRLSGRNKTDQAMSGDHTVRQDLPLGDLRQRDSRARRWEEEDRLADERGVQIRARRGTYLPGYGYVRPTRGTQY